MPVQHRGGKFTGEWAATHNMNLFYKISIDHVNANYISGWCFNRFAPGRSVVLECYAGDVLLATASADRFREDLQSLGMHRSGKCGFEFVIEVPPRDGSKTYTIRVKNTNRPLAVADVSSRDVRYQKPFAALVSRRKSRASGPQKNIVFMHIPKTAGTSFNALAQHMFGEASVRTHIELVDENRFAEIASACRYISGHMRFHQLDQAFDSHKNDFYTILREPYGQLHSHMKWLIQTSADREDTFFKHNNPVIYRLGRQLGEIGGFTLQNLEQLVERLASLEAAFLDNSQTRYFLDGAPDRVGDRDFAQALDNVSRFKLIGLTEQYDRFVEQFVTINSVSTPVRRDRLNKSASDHLFDYRDPEIREVLRPLVRYDLKLYDLVKNGIVQ